MDNLAEVDNLVVEVGSLVEVVDNLEVVVDSLPKRIRLHLMGLLPEQDNLLGMHSSS